MQRVSLTTRLRLATLYDKTPKGKLMTVKKRKLSWSPTVECTTMIKDTLHLKARFNDFRIAKYG